MFDKMCTIFFQVSSYNYYIRHHVRIIPVPDTDSSITTQVISLKIIIMTDSRL